MNSVVDETLVPSRPLQRTRAIPTIASLGGPIVIALMAALVALAAAVDSGGARPFTSMRWALVSSCVAAAAVGVRRWALPRWHAVAWVVLISAMVVGAVTGPDMTTALLGHPQRHLGVFAWVVFALAAATGAQLASRYRALSVLEVGVVIIAGNIVVTSAIDALGWDPAGASFAGGRVGGVFGQPVVLASVAVLLLPMVAACRRVGHTRWVVAAGLIMTIGLTQTRGAVLGLLAIAVASGPTWIRASSRRLGDRRRLLRIAVAAAAAIVVLTIGPLGDRLADSASSSRLDEWKLGLDVLVEHPLFGVGPEGYRIAVLEHLDASYVADYGRDVVVDRAHSAPLDVGLSGGVFAGVSYLTLIGSVAVTTWRRQQAESLGRSDRIAVAAGLGAIGAFAAALVAFPVPEIDAVVWSFAGISLASPAASNARSLSWRAGNAVVPGVAALALALAVWAGATDVLSDHDMSDAVNLAAGGRTSDALSSAKSAVERRGDLVDSHWLAASVAATGPTILDLDEAIQLAETSLERFPRDPALLDLRADLVVERALRSGLAVDVDTAMTVLGQLKASDPTSLIVESGTDRLSDACLIRCDNQP